jgi:hypothetical protein
MKWLLHGTISPAVADALRRHGDDPHALPELELPAEAGYGEILKAATSRQWDVLSNDDRLIDTIYDQDIWFARTVVFLQLAGGEVEQDDAIDRLFTRYKRLSPGRLYTVTETRVKVRQLPSRH